MDIFEELSRLVFELEHRSKYCTDLQFSLDELDSFINTLSEQVMNNEHQDCLLKLIQNLKMIAQDVFEDIKNVQFSTSISLQEPSTDHGVGRPKMRINAESLLHFRGLGYTWTEISEIFLISRTTMWRRVRESGLDKIMDYSKISDEELDAKIREYRNIHGLMTGRSMLLGYLKSEGLKIQQARVRDALLRIDPESSHIRWSNYVQRCQYNVPAPNYLWHIDGYHALVNWGFVIHGCIDGFSRFITYLHCSTNNYKETVLSLFQQAITNNGIPSRVRTDRGGENILVWKKMVELKGPDRGSYIAGTSVHNQRIERLWRDIWNSVACQFYYTFQALEAEELYDNSNIIHKYVLHYVFKPRINHTLQKFVSGWNNHPLRTEKNWSPARLWTHGMIDNRNDHFEHVYHFQNMTHVDLENYGIDFAGPVSYTDDELSTVEVEDVLSPLSAQQQDILQTIDPLEHSNLFGLDIYIKAIKLLSIDEDIDL